MSVIGSNILAGASGQGGDYTIARSLRFRSSASAYLNRTPASSPTSSRKCTFSWWAKISNMTTSQKNFIGSGAFKDGIQLAFNNNIDIYFDNGTSYRTTTSAVFRDPSAWYHFVVSIDTTQATSADRVKIYVNGIQQTSTSGTMIPQNYDFNFNSSGNTHRIGTDSYSGYYDGYMAEFYDIDGQALTPSSFGEYNSKTGVWQPKKYAGTYGTNGFYLPFSDNSSTTTLGADSSGNGNNWTTNNISLTAGSTYDSMTDVPTLTSATEANYCVINPLDNYYNAGTVSDGNLQVVTGSSSTTFIRGTQGVSSGKWYFEATAYAATGNTYYDIGWSGRASTSSTATLGSSADQVGYLGSDGTVGINNVFVSSGTTYTTGDVIGAMIDLDNNLAYFSKNGTLINSGTGYSIPAASATTTGFYYPALGDIDSGGTKTWIANFGQRPFAYTPPTGYVALNTFNLD